MRKCIYCHHADHAPGDECEASMTHRDGKYMHRCLCLNRPDARRSCPPQMDCQGGYFGYGDLYYLQQGHNIQANGCVITPDMLEARHACATCKGYKPENCKRNNVLPHLCPHCLGWTGDPEHEGEWVEEAGMFRPLVRCPVCLGSGQKLPAPEDRHVGYVSRANHDRVYCLNHTPDSVTAHVDWMRVTASQLEGLGARRTCSHMGCGVDLLKARPLPTTACDDPPCDWDGSGEPCDRHEREQAHAEGDHSLCELEITCEFAYPSEMLRNTILYRAIPGSKTMLTELERRAAIMPSPFPLFKEDPTDD